LKDTLSRSPLASSDLTSAGYDPETQRLEVEFKKGTKLYSYHGVPPEVYQGLMTAVSPGKYFYANIKGKYAYTSWEMNS
jgi:hypothetical protein